MTPASPVEDDFVDDGDAGVPRSASPVAAPASAGAAAVPAEPTLSERTNLKRVLIAFLPITLLGILISLDFPLCPSKNLFGVPCPGCGLTRATESMIGGDFLSMLRFHPLAPIITPVAIFSFARATLISAGLLTTRSKDPLSKIPNAVWTIIGVVLIGLWVVRLSGGLGGHPDEIDFSEGWIAQGVLFLWHTVAG